MEIRHWDPNRHACPTLVAIRSVGERAAAAKSQLDEFAIDPSVDEVAWRGHLGSGCPIRKVTAGVRGRRVELQRGEREIVKPGHASTSDTFGGIHCAVAGEFTNAATRSANARRGMGRAPIEARCEVSC